MAQYYGAPPNQAYAPSSAQNLQFYPTQFTQQAPGAPPQQGGYGGYGAPPGSAGGYGAPTGNMAFGGSGGFGAAAGVSGRMGEQGGLRMGLLAAFSTEGYDGEPPLLEELGVNFGHIQAKTLAVLNPFARIDQHLMDDSDLAGPILFFILFGTFLLLSGKLHFGYIYGLAAVGSLLLHFILSLMSPSDIPGATPYGGAYGQPGGVGPSQAQGVEDIGGQNNLSSTLTFSRSASVLGYCLLPLVATSLVGIAVPMDTPLGIVMTCAAITWCTFSASGIFCAVGRMRAMRALVAYPLGLFYVGFGIMAVFSSRGSGLPGKVLMGKAAGVS